MKICDTVGTSRSTSISNAFGDLGASLFFFAMKLVNRFLVLLVLLVLLVFNSLLGAYLQIQYCL